MAIITAIREIRRGGKEGLGQVDLNKVPTEPESAGGSVGDKEEEVCGEKDRSVTGGGGRGGSRNRRVIRGTDRNGCGRWNRGVGETGGGWNGSQSVGVGFVTESE
jgi:hypothetical protein